MILKTLTQFKWVGILFLLLTQGILLEAQQPCSIRTNETPVCNMQPTCDENGNITIEVLDTDLCECVTRPVTKPTCKYGETYDLDMCMCVPYNCYKICDPTPTCNGDGWLYKKVLNPETCECETKPLPTPTCASGEIYDKEHCKCIPDCTINCYRQEWCENGIRYKKALDIYNCECVTKVVGTVSCPTGKIYDPYTCDCIVPPCTLACEEKQWCQGGHTYKTVLDYDNCNCITKKVARPDCGLGKIYDLATCGCIPKPCTLTCSGVEWCENGHVYKKVLDQTTCTCVTQQVVQPVCPTGHVYNHQTCACAPKPCTLYCEEKEWCENGIIYKQSLDHQTCNCATTQVSPTCSNGEAFDPVSCSCKLVFNPISCDDVQITANNGAIFIDNLHAPIEVVRVLDAHWQVVYQCIGNCNDNEKILTNAGTYYVSVQLYNHAWQQICKKNTYVTVGTNNLPNETPELESYQCGGVKVSYGYGTIHLKGAATKEYIFRVYKRLGNWKEILKCGYSCGHEAKLENLTDGSYYIEVFNKNGARACTARTIHIKGGHLTNASSSRHAQATLQLDIAKAPQHMVFPNPAKQELFVDLAAYKGQKGTVQLVNSVGQIVQQLDFDEIPANTVQLDLQQTKSGLHFLTIILESDLVITEKILVDK